MLAAQYSTGMIATNASGAEALLSFTLQFSLGLQGHFMFTSGQLLCYNSKYQYRMQYSTTPTFSSEII